MKARSFFIFITTLLLIAGVTTGITEGLNGQPALHTVAQLENVRAYAAASHPEGVNYAVEGGALYAGADSRWTEVRTPNGVIVSAVAIDANQPERVYIGAANELTLFRTTNAGRNWQRIALVDGEAAITGGVTALAVDPVQQLVYAGTDTAGLFRLRDVGSSIVLTARLLTDDPVREIAVDQSGQGALFARTDWTLYRGENYGLAWVTVDGIGSAPTALAIGAASSEATPVVYVGTMDRGLLRSTDGHNWAAANEGLNFVPGSRLSVNALAVDPAQPDTLYIATSYLYGSAEAHSTPSMVYMGMGSALAWSPVSEILPATAAALLPVSGQPGAVYALTTTSRTPMALGAAPEMAAAVVDMATAAPAAQPVAQTGPNWTAILAWIVAGLAAAALVFAVLTDVRRRPTPVAGAGHMREPHMTERTVTIKQ